MLDESLQEQAALYASGGMTACERERFELVLEFHCEVRALVAQLEEISAGVTLADAFAAPRKLSTDLKAKILAKTQDIPQARDDGFVMAGKDGLVQWVNSAFTEMCGYTLDELRGKKLGPILQGPLTDRVVAERMRDAVQALQPCREEILNYHKNGNPYWVAIEITPILDENGEPRWLVAREREMKEKAGAAR